MVYRQVYAASNKDTYPIPYSETHYTLSGIISLNSLKTYPKGYKLSWFHYVCTLKGIFMELKDFVKEKRRLVKHTQPNLARKAGVGLRFLRELEQGKKTLRVDKVNKVLWLFGYELGPVEMSRDIDINSESGGSLDQDDKIPKMDRYL